MPFDFTPLHQACGLLIGVTIRAASVDDIDHLSAMIAQAANMHAEIAPHLFRRCPPAATERLRATLSKMVGKSPAQQQMLVAINDTRPIAVAQVGIEEQPQKLFRHERRVARLSWLWVEKHFRRKGVAKDLLQAVAAWSRAQNCGEIICHVVTSNDPSLSLFQASGYAKQTHILSLNLQPQDPAESR